MPRVGDPVAVIQGLSSPQLRYGRLSVIAEDIAENRDEVSRWLAVLNAPNCGTGAGGFKKGNKCAVGSGSKSSSKSKSDQKFEELMKTKSPKDAEAFRKARMDGIAIPPAWTDVKYYGANKDIRAEGRDAVGRKQRAENPAYRQRISNENNVRIAKDLEPKMSKLRNQLRKDAQAGDEESKVLYLISQTGFRIGGKIDPRAKKAAYGASTLRGEHVKVDGNKVTFDFPGKKGVRQLHTVDDPVIAGMMKNAKPGEPIFKTRDTKVRDAWKNRYGGKKVHDIRHVVATEEARKVLSKLVPPSPTKKTQRNKIIKQAAIAASKRLGNNPSQALSTYIDPQIFSVVEITA